MVYSTTEATNTGTRGQITVADALALDVLRGTRVVAGHAGLGRVIEWVHNVGVPDAARWLNGGELVLTTAINMPSTPEAQEVYLLEIIEKGVAGLGLAVGRFIDAIPEHLHRVADAHAFPLLEVPYVARFVDIAREINRAIAQRDVRRALQIHQTLTRLVLDGDLNQLAETMAGLIHQSVSIENERFEAYASVNIADVDEARIYTQKYGRTDPRLVRALDERGYLPQIRQTLRPVHLPQMPDVGLGMERILAPIVVHGEIYGFMWVIADERPLSELEWMAIESGTTIAALMLLRQEAVQREEASQRRDLLAGLMGEDAAVRADILTDRVLRYGVDLRQPFRALLVEGGAEPPNRQYDRVSRMVETRIWSMVAGGFAGQLMLLAQDNEHLPDVIEQTYRALSSEGVTLRIGVSGAGQGVAWAARAYEQCREALIITKQLNDERRIARFDDLGYLHALYRAGPAALDGNPHLPALRRLLHEQTADLFHTLEVYLDLGGSGVAAAEALHVHRSTLNYRLSRIEDICGVELSDAGARTDLHMTLKLMRLFGAS